MKDLETKTKDFYETPTVRDIPPVTVAHGEEVITQPEGDNYGNDDDD